MNSGKRHRVHFFNVESTEDISPPLPGPMHSTWTLWTNFLRNVHKTATSASSVATAPPETSKTMAIEPPFFEKMQKVNFSESSRVEEVVLPLDWAEYLMFKERMHRRRSTGSHIIRGIKRLRIKRLRSEILITFFIM